MENNFYLNKFVNNVLDLPENRESLQYLGRLTQDCLYYFGQGNRADKYLWGRTAQEHIKKMKELVDSLPFDIEWCTPRDVMLFEKCFYTKEDTICLCQDAKVKLWDYLPDRIVGKDDETDIEEYISKQWFLDKMVPDPETGIEYYAVFIGGKPVDYLRADSILMDEIKEINNRRY